MLFQTCVVSLLLVSICSAQNPTIDQLFTVDSTCNEVPIQAILDDARTMLGEALNATNTLLNSDTFVRASTRNFLRNAANSFGTTYYSPLTVRGMSSADKATLNTVSNNLQLVQTLLNGGIALGQQLNAGSAFLACSGDAYKLTDDAHFIDPTLPEGTSCNTQYKVQRVFYAKNSPMDSRGRKTAVLRPGEGQGNVCGTDGDDDDDSHDDDDSDDGNKFVVNAETFPSSRNPTKQPITQLVLCDLLFNGKEDTRGAAWQTTINPNPGPPAQNAPKPLWKFTAGVLIHEMFHILAAKGYVDRLFLDKTGADVLPYGPQNIFNIANGTGIDPVTGDLTTTNLPDAYRMFCEECHFSGTSWNISGEGG